MVGDGIVQPQEAHDAGKVLDAIFNLCGRSGICPTDPSLLCTSPGLLGGRDD